MASNVNVEKAFNLAREQYAAWGVDVDAALKTLQNTPISLHCWQGDDVAGFEGGSLSGGGIMATGAYPGRARTPDELRQDFQKAFSLLPGKHRANIHMIYAETGGKKVGRNELQPEHFANWINWAKAQKLGLDFNGSFFSHPLAADGFTLSHRDAGIRKFWIEHGIASRKIAAEMGKATGSPSVCNIWIPDGYKDVPVDRATPRKRLMESLDAVLKEQFDKRHLLDAVEAKLFGIGSEAYVVGSHEFYMGYAVSRKTLLCLDCGHFHPTEVISDKISSVLQYLDQVLLHVSRGIRWDSDHVVALDDELRAIAAEIVRGGYLNRVHIGLDFFDASINRVAAWVIGARNMLRALMGALLEPTEKLKRLEAEGDLTGRLALLEEAKLLPVGAVWDYYCLQQNVPVGPAWLEEVRAYEKNVLSARK